jgi:SAM-dependent methyltransferase
VGARVLDVGCGTGRVAHALAERGARVWGVDASDEMLSVARRRELPGGGFKRGQAERLPFKDGWFDAAVLRQVVHLVERPRTFAELGRVLRPGGRAVIATFDRAHFEGYWLGNLFPSVDRIDRGRFPTLDELEVELRGAGFGAPAVTRLTQPASLSRDEALERIRGRYISTLHLLDPEEYDRGLARAEQELPERVEYELDWLVLAAANGPAPR